jgi:pimeloyl-ACP methyl ester carboxylesterase
VSGEALIERAIQFGDGGRVFGVLTEPPNKSAKPGQSPVFVILSAGLLHRVGPSRMHVTLARELAQLGFPVVRVDLSGKGDSPAREGLTNQESVGADFADIVAGIGSIFPSAKLVLVGMCSGADNAIRLSILESSVIGMVLLDAVCPSDSMFKIRSMKKYLEPFRYLRRLRNVFGEGARTVERAVDADIDRLQFRDLPTFAQTQDSFRALLSRNGAVLAIFTQSCLKYYNKQGQLGKVLVVEDYDLVAEERFWPEVEHTWQLSIHRRRLINEIMQWAHTKFRPLNVDSNIGKE